MPRMVGEKSSIVPVAIGGIIIAAVAVAVWYATRGSQVENVNSGSSSPPSARLTPPSGDNATSDNATSDNSASESGNATSGSMGADNSVGAMGAENSAGAMGGNSAGTDNAMGSAGNTSPMGSAGQNSVGGMNGAGNSASPMTGSTPMGAPKAMGGNAMPVPPPNTNQ